MRAIPLIVTVVTSCLFIMPLQGMAADSPNYCLDSESNATWSRMFSDAPDDDQITGLFALRLGLCELVRRDVITLDRASGMFEQARARAVAERKRKQRREQLKRGGGA